MRLTPLESATLPASGLLGALVDDVLERIGDALDGQWPPWALPTVATIGGAGPRARILALRASDASTRSVVFHGDARSDKVGELRADPRVCIVFWDSASGIEARFTGDASIHVDDEVAQAAWRNVSPLRRLASRSIAAPGATLPVAARFDALPVQAEEGVPANFAVIRVEVVRLDWLWVGADDMRRAVFHWTGSSWDGAWTVP